MSRGTWRPATSRSSPRRPQGPAWRAPGTRHDTGREAAVKVFLSSDMEGTAGVVDWEQCAGAGPEAAAGRALLLAEVNAAIEGVVDRGATEIVVNDSHYHMRNLPAGALAG